MIGLDLSTERKIDLSLTCGANQPIKHYVYAVTQKILSVSPEGMMCS